MRIKEREIKCFNKAKLKAQNEIYLKKRKEERSAELVHLQEERKMKKRKPFEADLLDSGLFVTLTDGSTVQVGEPTQLVNLKTNPLFSYNYFEKITNANGEKFAKCLICASTKLKDEIKIIRRQSIGLRKHLRGSHPSIYDRFLIQKKEHEKMVEVKRKKYKEAYIKMNLRTTTTTSESLTTQSEDELVDSILKEEFTIGEPDPGFDINKSVHYTHKYFKKISKARAICLICLKSSEKKRHFLKIIDSNTSGKKDND